MNMNNFLSENIYCEFDKWEGIQTRNTNLVKATERRHRMHHGDKQHNGTIPRPSKNDYHEENGQRWDSFHSRQASNVILPALTGIMKGLYDGSSEQKCVRRHAKGNEKIGPISHRQGACVEPWVPGKAST
ncbi:expressed unknown protein [Seminavis robusta]|uniref:Uncharacterized protein n=1 Tax=Seminavis robusta TaxID=568900 RepID=A0A9N8D6W2_9STRA|nr:expressed unknown protein [Seminavis robusta]|eukprot:Sro20_g014150.1 n/a (130) ;mRNA; r:91578-91967